MAAVFGSNSVPLSSLHKRFLLQLHPDKHSIVAFTASSLLSVRRGIKKAELNRTDRLLVRYSVQPPVSLVVLLGRVVLFETLSRPTQALQPPMRRQLVEESKEQIKTNGKWRCCLSKAYKLACCPLFRLTDGGRAENMGSRGGLGHDRLNEEGGALNEQSQVK